MKILKLISGLSIVVLILLMSILLFLNKINLATVKMLMLIGTVLWFVSTPFWMKEEKN